MQHLTRTALIALTTVVLALPVLGATNGHQPPPPITTITVMGHATLTGKPDLAAVSANITTNAADAATAQSRNTTIYDAAVAAVTKLAVAKRDIRYGYYNMNYVPRPTGNATPQPWQRYGYTITHSFTVRVHAVGNVGRIIDALVGAGVTNVQNVSFTLAHPGNLERRAQAEAVRNARLGADSLAKAAGLRIVGIRRIAVGYQQVFPRPMMYAPKMLAAATPPPTPITPSNITVEGTVTVAFIAR
ncbi:MAG: SIMPL domain-containing protein [Vulcanimicrobiaceae bacterium]